MNKIYGPGSVCKVSGCSLKVRAKWLCNTHYQRKQAGDPNWFRPVTRHKDGAVWRSNFRMWPDNYPKVLKLAEELGLTFDDAVNVVLEAYFQDRALRQALREQQIQEIFKKTYQSIRTPTDAP